jgi:hypothetical protein
VIAKRNFVDELNRRFEVPANVKRALIDVCSGCSSDLWVDCLKSELDVSFESIIDCATAMLRNVVNNLVQSSGVVLLNELCLILGSLGMHRQSNLALSVLCKHAVGCVAFN